MQERAIDLPLSEHDDEIALCTCLLVNWAKRVDDFKAGSWDVEELLDADLLVIDDLGAEHDPSKAGAEKLYYVLERRECRWTLITSNYGPNQWEQRFERRIADRLFRNCEHLDLSELPSFSTTV